jgi:hypothetical protein
VNANTKAPEQKICPVPMYTRNVSINKNGRISFVADRWKLDKEKGKM